MDAVRSQLKATLRSAAPSPAIYLQGPTIDASLWLEVIRDALPTPVDNFHAAVPNMAVIDCELVLSVRQLYESILNQLTAYPMSWLDGMRNWDGQMNGFDFVQAAADADTSDDESSQPRKRRRRAIATQTFDESDKLSTTWQTKVQPDRQPLEPPRDSSEYLNSMLFRLSGIYSDKAPLWRAHIVLQNAEHLTTLPSAPSLARGGSVLNTLARLEEFTKCPVTVIFVSRLGYEKLREPSLPLLRVIRWPSVPQQDIASLLISRFKLSASETLLSEPEYRTLFSALVQHVATTTSTYTAGRRKDVAYIVSRLWSAWKVPAERGNPSCKVTDTARLAQNIKDLLNAELQHVAEARSWDEKAVSAGAFAGRIEGESGNNAFMNALTGTATTTAATSTAGGSSTARFQPKKAAESLVAPLPVLARWLLISAYFASVNRPSTDVRYFVRLDDQSPQKGKKSKRRSPSKSPTKQATKRADLNGGRPFALERLIAIFQAIACDETIVSSEDALLQINMLISVRLLQRASAESKVLDGVKLRCQFDRETAERVALSVGLKNWRDYLDEFE